MTKPNCIDCPECTILPDPDPNDWFCDDDVKVVCKVKKNKSITAWFCQEVGEKMKKIIAEEYILGTLGEGIHSTFRKGCEAPQAVKIHKLISEIPADEWHRYLEYLLWGLRESGLTIRPTTPRRRGQHDSL